jgi:hypothetical protein
MFDGCGAKIKKRLLRSETASFQAPCLLPLTNYCCVVVSEGFGVIGVVVVVSIGVVVVVSVFSGIGVVVAVSVVIGGDCVSFPVEFSGVSQPIVVPIANKAIKRMLFMSFTLMFNNEMPCPKA